MIPKTPIDFENYIKKSNFKGIKIVRDDHCIKIIPTIFNAQIINDLILFGALSYGVYSMKSESFYLIPTLFLFSIVLIKSWQDFDYINRIRFNLESGEIQIESRNILKKIFRTSIQKSFDSYRFAPEIKFKVRDSEGWMSYSRRYYVDLEISDNKKIRLIGFSDEKEAYNVSLFFDSLSKTRQHNR